MLSVEYSLLEDPTQMKDWLAVKLLRGISVDTKGISIILQQSLIPACTSAFST